MTGKQLIALSLLTLVAGCASYSGSGLTPGKSTAADVQSAMGAPIERNDDGAEQIWWYPRPPFANYAVRLDRSGVVQSIEQRLTRQYMAKLMPGMTSAQVRLIVGPPENVSRLPRVERDIWEYRFRDFERMRLWIQFSYDGPVREVLIMDDPERHAHPDGPGCLSPQC